jgi:isocitrate lyase
MSAYSILQQKEFAAEPEGYRAIKHQAFVGTGYFDDVAQTIAGGVSSTTALHGSTEQEQFHPCARVDCENRIEPSTIASAKRN